MTDRIQLAFRRQADRLLAGEPRVWIAVSGGSDSIALLRLLAEWRERRNEGPRLHVAHLDHGLRPESPGDRRFVERAAAALGLPCRAERREVPRLRRRGESPEEAARRVRREFLLDVRGGRGAIATGHTLDDQAETVLLRLARGASTTALAGMRERGPGPFARPLLGFERTELRRWLDRRGVEFREDPQNEDLRFDRNRVRHLVVPLLRERLNPRTPRHLVAAADRLGEDARLLDRIAQGHLAALRRGSRGAAFALDADGLSRLETPLARRVLRAAVAGAGFDLRRISSRHLEALLDLARGAPNRRVDLPGKGTGRRTPRLLRLEIPRW